MALEGIELTDARLQSSIIYDGAIALTPKFAFANIAASTTDGAIIAAVATKKIRVLSWIAVAAATATNITFTSKPAGAGAAKSALLHLGQIMGQRRDSAPLVILRQ